MTTYTLRERLEAGIEYAIKRFTILPLAHWAIVESSMKMPEDLPTPQEFYKEERENLLIEARQRTVARQKARRKADLPIDYC